MTAPLQSSPQLLLPSLLKWLVAAVLFVSLNFGLATQIRGLERSAEESFSTELVLQKKISDDAGKVLDVEQSIDELLAGTPVFSAGLVAAFSTTSYLAAAYLAAFINASPRAPPLR